MYLNKTKIKVISFLIDENQRISTPKSLVLIRDVIENVDAKKENVIKAVTALSLVDYVKITYTDKSYYVTLNKSGLSAYANKQFQIEQHDRLRGYIHDASMIIINAALAFIAIYSVVTQKQDNKQQIERIIQLEHKMQETTQRLGHLKGKNVDAYKNNTPVLPTAKQIKNDTN
jgi:hypothetical protein